MYSSDIELKRDVVPTFGIVHTSLFPLPPLYETELLFTTQLLHL